MTVPGKDTQTPICPCHGWPMLPRTGHLGFLCLWCGATVEPDGRSGRWRDHKAADLVKWGRTERPGDAGTSRGMADQTEGSGRR